VELLAATALLFECTRALVVGVGWIRSRGGLADAEAKAMEFAFSGAGVLSAALVSASVLGATSFLAARLEATSEATRLDAPSLAARLRLGPTNASAAGVCAAAVGTVALSLACGAVSDLLGVGESATMDLVARAFAHGSPTTVLLGMGAIAIAPGAAEEVFFRGLLQARFAARFRRSIAVALTALAFGLIHLDLVQGTLAFLVGLYLGWLAERLGGVRPTIVAHGINNALFIAIASLSPDGGLGRAAETAGAAIGVFTCVAATAFLRTPLALRVDPPSRLE
jgi:membrane protease YdiL (CAAX protease family)